MFLFGRDGPRSADTAAGLGESHFGNVGGRVVGVGSVNPGEAGVLLPGQPHDVTETSLRLQKVRHLLTILLVREPNHFSPFARAEAGRAVEVLTPIANREV